MTYFHCPQCGFLQTEEPYWLDEAYQEALNITDTGILERNIFFLEITAPLLYHLFDKDAKYLDYAGGYGIYTRLMRDIGFDFYWKDKYSVNLLSRGFEYKGDEDIELVTCFECFEHFLNPVQEIENILKLSNHILFSTHLLPEPVPTMDEWWYYGPEHGQHISFYSSKTLSYLSQRFGLAFHTNGVNLHLFTGKKLDRKKVHRAMNRKGKKYSIEYVKRRMKSRTFSDHRTLAKKRMEK